MKKLLRTVIIGLLILGLGGCVTAGKPYDDSKMAMIKKGATTEAELVDWFGPPSVRTLNDDGTKMLAWKFGSSKTSGSHSAASLNVRLDAEGKVAAYSASARR